MPEEAFLTKQTAEGLRMTLRSTLDLLTNLTKFHAFKNIYTGRINQDPLEGFEFLRLIGLHGLHAFFLPFPISFIHRFRNLIFSTYIYHTFGVFLLASLRNC